MSYSFSVRKRDGWTQGKRFESIEMTHKFLEKRFGLLWKHGSIEAWHWVLRDDESHVVAEATSTPRRRDWLVRWEILQGDLE